MMEPAKSGEMERGPVTEIERDSDGRMAHAGDSKMVLGPTSSHGTPRATAFLGMGFPGEASRPNSSISLMLGPGLPCPNEDWVLGIRLTAQWRPSAANNQVAEMSSESGY